MAGPKSFFLTPEIHEYVVAHGTPPDAVQQALIDETAELPMAMMQISPEQGAFMTLFTRAIGAKQAVEVGTFTGYSAIAIARGLPDDGHLLCCDVSEEWTSVGRRAWAEAGVDDKIELVIAPAAARCSSACRGGWVPTPAWTWAWTSRRRVATWPPRRRSS